MRAATTQPNGRPQASPEVTTIREYSNLVVVDVVVSDSQGNPIHGLRPSDFALLENNKLQILKHFEEHSAVPASDLKIALAPKLPPGLFTNKTPAPANGPVNVLLLDYLNTPLASQPFLRMQLREFLDKAPAGTRIAIFFLNTQLSMLQGFTSDMSVLKAALASKKGVPDVSHIAQGKDTTLDALTINQPQEIIDSVHRMESLDASDRRNMQALYTLNAFDMLARYLVGIPGRKNVIWFSGGFPLDVEPDLNEADPNDSVVRNDDAVRQTDNLLTRAQVAVYPVDARGLQGDPALSDGLGGQALLDARANAAYNLAVPSGVTPDKANDAVQGASVMAWLQTHAQEQLTMMAMAEDTGGEAFVNTNSLAQAATRAIEHGSNYYTLTYSPTNIQWDARFRTIKVKVNQSGAKLIYRNGYYAVDPNDRNKLNAAGAATALAQTNTMATAMMHGGPEATEILFKVRIRPVNEVPSDAVPASNQVNPKMNVVGPYRQYAVDLVPDAQAVNCHEGADGNRHCAIEVWTFVYNSDGEKVITASNRLHNLLTPADYKKLLAGGMAFHQQISVPAKGEYYLRTAIHDMVSDRVGAVEVPVGAVARLDPLKQVAAVAPAPTSTPAVSVPVEVPSTAPPAAEPTAPPTLKRRAAPSTNSADPTGTPN